MDNTRVESMLVSEDMTTLISDKYDNLLKTHHKL